MLRVLLMCSRCRETVGGAEKTELELFSAATDAEWCVKQLLSSCCQHNDAARWLLHGRWEADGWQELARG